MRRGAEEPQTDPVRYVRICAAPAKRDLWKPGSNPAMMGTGSLSVLTEAVRAVAALSGSASRYCRRVARAGYAVPVYIDVGVCPA